jgi:hypothetical protein
MKLPHRMLTFVVLLAAAMMAVNEFPELLTLTDNTSNDYVSVRIGYERARPGVVKDPVPQATAAPLVFTAPVGLCVTAASDFLRSSTAKSPRSLLLLLVTHRN